MRRERHSQESNENVAADAEGENRISLDEIAQAIFSSDSHAYMAALRLHLHHGGSQAMAH